MITITIVFDKSGDSDLSSAFDRYPVFLYPSRVLLYDL